MSDTDRELIGVRLPSELAALVRADKRTNQEVVEAALWAEYGGQNQAAIERRIEELDRRMSTIESEKNERERELTELQEKRERLVEQKQNTVDARKELAKDCIDAVGYLPDSHDNSAVENWAEKADMESKEFYKLMQEVHNA